MHLRRFYLLMKKIFQKIHANNEGCRDDNVVSEEVSIGSFTKFVSPCE